MSEGQQEVTQTQPLPSNMEATEAGADQASAGDGLPTALDQPHGGPRTFEQAAAATDEAPTNAEPGEVSSPVLGLSGTTEGDARPVAENTAATTENVYVRPGQRPADETSIRAMEMLGSSRLPTRTSVANGLPEGEAAVEAARDIALQLANAREGAIPLDGDRENMAGWVGLRLLGGREVRWNPDTHDYEHVHRMHAQIPMVGNRYDIGTTVGYNGRVTGRTYTFNAGLITPVHPDDAQSFLEHPVIEVERADEQEGPGDDGQGDQQWSAEDVSTPALAETTSR